VVAVVLAYQATASDGPDEFEQWSPAEFTDADLEALLGKRHFTTARRRHAAGYLARVHPATPTEPVPWVELPNCSVRFLVPHDLGYARSDARDTKEGIALAVWAWQAWTARGEEAGDRHFGVGGGDDGGGGDGAGSDAAGVSEPGLADASGAGGGAGQGEIGAGSSLSAGGLAGDAGGVAGGAVGPGESGSGSLPGAGGSAGGVDAASGAGGAVGPSEIGAAGSGVSPAGTAANSGAVSGSGQDKSPSAPPTAIPPALTAAVDLAADIFLTGVANLAAGFTPRLARVRRDLDSAGLRWPLLAAEELADQLAAHAERAARHQRVLVADLLAEFVARARVAGSALGQPRLRVLGTDEAAEVALRRLRLTALGCRVQAIGENRRVLVFLADPAAGVVLTLDGRFEDAAVGADLAGRRLAGSTVGVLAAGNVVTETAHRRADRRLRLAVNRVARTTVSQSGGAWGHLPRTLLARDLDALTSEFDRMPPRLVRPRVDAEDVRVVEIGEVEYVGYEPGSQRLVAVVHGTGGGSARIVSEHRSVAPGALDALAEALTNEPRYVSATVRRGRGGLVLTPIAVACDGRVVVPDLAVADTAQSLEDGTGPRPDPLSAAIEGAFDLLAEMAHRGARHLPPSFPERLEATARQSDAAGLGRSATDIRGLGQLLGPDPGRAAFDAWADAAIRLITTAELR
jgi:hypothetical protein